MGDPSDTLLARFLGRRATRTGVFLLALLYGSAVFAPLLASDRPYVLVAADARAFERARKTLPTVVDELVQRRSLDALGVPRDAGREALRGAERAVRQRLDTLRLGLPEPAARRVDALESDLGAFLSGDRSGDELSERVRALADELQPEGGVALQAVTTYPLLRSLTPLEGALAGAWLTFASAPLWWRRRRRRGLLAGGVLTAALAFAPLLGRTSATVGAGPKAELGAAEVRVERVVFPPIPFGFAETHLEEDLVAPSWTGAEGNRPREVVVRAGEPSADSPWRHVLGTDPLGRDVLARLLHGGRISLAVGVIAAGLLVLVGVLLGGLAGYFGGAVDFVFLRVVEVLQSFPAFLLTLTGVALVPARTLHPMLTIALVIAFVGWTGVGRLVRAELLRLRELELTTAARALGLSPLRIAFRHLLPAALPPVLVAAAFATSNAVLTESAISFLGLGIGPPTPSWGALIAVERDAGAWWLQVFPGLMVFLTVVSYNLVGEGLREALDPAEARLGVGGRALRQGAPS